MSPAEDNFRKLVKAWDDEHKENCRLHAMWLDSCERRLRLAVQRNNAWAELEMERAAIAKATGSPLPVPPGERVPDCDRSFLTD